MRRLTGLGIASLTLGIVVLVQACGGVPESRREEPESTGARKPQVTATCFPVHWLVERIAGERVEALNILPAGQDPRDWQPSAATIAELYDADLIVINGAEYETWIGTAALPVSRIVDTTRGLELINVEGTTHSHGLSGKHSHAGTDPHTWFDPLLFLDQARAIHAALSRIDPGNIEHYDRELQSLVDQLTELDRDYSRALEASADRRLAANHLAYEYLARRYGLNLRSFDMDPGAVPSEEQLRRFSEWAGDAGSAVLFWESAPAPEVSGAFPPWVRHQFLDPLEQPDADGAYDYLAQARSNLTILEELFPRPR